MSKYNAVFLKKCVIFVCLDNAPPVFVRYNKTNFLKNFFLPKLYTNYLQNSNGPKFESFFTDFFCCI